MKRLVLTAVTITCVWALANGQATATASAQKTENPKRRVVKMGPPNGLFSPAIIVGDLVFTSGQIGLDPKTGQFPEGGIEAQLEQVFRNLSGVLEASGSSVDNIVKATVFLADMNDYNVMNELYRKKFSGDPPARTTVQVAKLPRDARIEIEAVAVLK
jgi:2-iminobutanoate/2-iminopropanoate deaminase